VVEIDVTASDLTSRRAAGHRQRGSHSFVPLWRVKALHPPPFGIPQAGYDLAIEAGLRWESGLYYIEEAAAYVDGVPITEDLGRTWSVGSQEFLCTPRALELL
jgi:hypothetical protein